MAYLRIETATIHANDPASLAAAWLRYRATELVGKYVLHGRLSPSRLRKLPAELRRCLEVRDKD